MAFGGEHERGLFGDVSGVVADSLERSREQHLMKAQLPFVGMDFEAGDGVQISRLN